MDRAHGSETYHALTRIQADYPAIYTIHYFLSCADLRLKSFRQFATPASEVDDPLSGLRIKQSEYGSCKVFAVDERRGRIILLRAPFVGRRR